MTLPLSKLPSLVPLTKIWVIKTEIGDTNFIAYCERNLPGQDLRDSHARIQEKKQKQFESTIQELKDLLKNDVNPKFGNKEAN